MRSLALLIVLIFSLALHAQVLPFKENTKWGLKENEKVIIPPVYDSVFTFDKQKKVCMVCFKSKNTSTSKFIKVTTNSLYCNYLNADGKRLILRTVLRDTFSVFLMGKNSVKYYTENDSLFKVSRKNLKYLVRKDFNQLSFGEYYDIDLADDPNYYVSQVMSEADVPLFGLITRKEDMVIPNDYSGIRMNPIDSLVMVCGAGIRAGSEDYVFSYEGKQLQAFRHHIDLATKQFIVFKLFEPKEHFVLHNRETNEEWELEADEVKYYQTPYILIRQKNEWFLYNPLKKEKSELKK
ncbi:MAG TPA: hypothetical protein PLQ93_05030 [Bacteroidia bacterium]|nr:hypothetical protein [Bacteroidia bacterium]